MPLRTVACRAMLAGCALLATPATSPGALAPSPLEAPPNVRTVAGSGAAGIAGGPASRASFLLPTAIARGSDGTLYVADEAAQRIRTIRPDGTVATLAGSGDLGADGLSVQGGYREGPALQAQFNRPNALALGADGALYVSDNRNACIRKIADGVTAPFAGTCGQSGSVDGVASAGRLKDPRAIVFGPDGTLYVADYGVGVRAVSRTGAITTLRLPSTDDKRFWGIGYAADPADPTLIAATPRVAVVYRFATGRDEAIGTNDPAEGNRPFGNVNQIAGLDHRQFLFTDLRTNNVRYLRWPVRPFATTVFTRVIAGGTYERAADNAGFRDGSWADSRFFVPRGIAVAGGVAYVTDAGNRRVRAITLPHLRVSEAGLSDTTAYDAAHYQLLYIGASWAFWDSLGDDSICARTEAEVDAAHRFASGLHCHPVRIDAASFAQIESYLADYPIGHLDAVVLNANLAEAFSLFPNSAPPSVDAAVTRFAEHAGALDAKLKKAGVKLVLLWTEDPEDVSASENYYEREDNPNRRFFPVDLRDNYAKGTKLLIDAAAKLGIREVDTRDDFIGAERDTPGAALFGTDDSHMSPRGSALTAHLLARYLIAEKSL